MGVILRWLCACALAAGVMLWPATRVLAQDGPPPALVLESNPAPAGRPFSAVFRIQTSVASVGFWGQPPQMDITGSTIRITFDRGCGFLCVPDTAYRSFPFEFPALTAGSYTVVFGNPDSTAAQFVMAVGTAGAPSVSVPLTGWPALIALIASFGLVATSRLRALNRLTHTDSST